MRNKSIFAIIIAVVMMLAFYSSTTSSRDSDVSALTVEDSTKIYLYGEEHHIKKINDKEFELWQGYYNDEGMRHLFIELSYYEAECLNLWMQSDNDEISDLLYEDNPSEFDDDFYKEIKKECPETVFHGTDIGHKVTSGYKYYMEYLEKNNMKDTEQYKLCLEAIEQGKAFYKDREHSYRENKMVENFIREFDKLDGESVMGIYGLRHTDLNALNLDYTVPCMGNQLNQHYEGMVFSEDLSTPPRIDTIKVNNKEYEAPYFGKHEMPWTEEYAYVEIWRLENAFDDFKEMPKSDNVIPYDSYPMILKDGQVFVRKDVKTDGSVIRSYYISDGYIWNDMPSTEEVILPSGQDTTKIYLYGEAHGVEKIIDKEFELWQGYYNDEGIRHLFVELPYYTAEYLNLWMESDNDDILDGIYEEWSGSASHKPYVKTFYKDIKSECPETVFHGTDVGHQYETTGKSYLDYLQNNNMKDSDQYKLTLEAIEQGKTFHKDDNYVYRENKMVENFVREFDKLDGESIMGIYGVDHTGLDSLDLTKSIPCMANQLNVDYESMIISEDISWLRKDIDPYCVETIEVNGKEYKALYYGEEDITGFKDYSYRKFWRLEDAFYDFKDKPKNGNGLPYGNYPMIIQEGQVMVMDMAKTNGVVSRYYFISDGGKMDGAPSTDEILIEQ